MHNVNIMIRDYQRNNHDPQTSVQCWACSLLCFLKSWYLRHWTWTLCVLSYKLVKQNDQKYPNNWPSFWQQFLTKSLPNMPKHKVFQRQICHSSPPPINLAWEGIKWPQNPMPTKFHCSWRGGTGGLIPFMSVFALVPTPPHNTKSRLCRRGIRGGITDDDLWPSTPWLIAMNIWLIKPHFNLLSILVKPLSYVATSNCSQSVWFDSANSTPLRTTLFRIPPFNTKSRLCRQGIADLLF